MSEMSDQRIAGLLNRVAPPVYDPFFRLAVLERRERKRFQIQLLALLVMALIAAIVLSSGIAMGADPGGLMFVLLVCGGVVASWAAAAPGVLLVVRSLRTYKSKIET